MSVWSIVKPGSLGGVWFDDACVDAYLVWDLMTDFARHDTPTAKHVPVLLELAEAGSANDLLGTSATARVLRSRLAGSRALAPASRIHTAMVPNTAVMRACLGAAVQSGAVIRFAFGAPCKSAGPVDPEPLPPVEFNAGAPLRTVGVIDDGCCLAHQDFRNRGKGFGKSRILALWDQEPSFEPAAGLPWNRYARGGAPPPCGYGLELAQADIDELLKKHPHLGERAERELYGDGLGRPDWGKPAHTHGARVMHLLAGTNRRASSEPKKGVDTGELPVIFVQLPKQTVADTSGDSLGFHVVDGARYIVARTKDHATQHAKDWRTTINLSLGSIAGPHDGTSMPEVALSDLVAGGKGKVNVVVAAGNTADDRRTDGVHGVREVTKKMPGIFHVRLPTNCARDSFVEFWIPGSAELDKMRVNVQSPDGLVKAAIKSGETHRLQRAHGPAQAEETQAGVIFANHVAQGTKGTMVLLALAPTARDPRRPKAASRMLAAPGVWTVTISSAGDKAVEVHAWVERDDIIVGERKPQQTRLEVESNTDRASRYIDDTHSLASLANAKGVFVAIGCVESSLAVASYSADGPRRDTSDEVDYAYALSERSPTLRGVATPGFFSGSRAVINGTSAAAPQVAREVARRLDRLSELGSEQQQKPKPTSNGLRRVQGDRRLLPTGGLIEGSLRAAIDRAGTGQAALEASGPAASLKPSATQPARQAGPARRR